MMALSSQAESLVKNLKEFDIEDFRKWWNDLPKVTQVGTSYLFQYIDMKEIGHWKDGKFTIEEIKWRND